MPKEKKHPDLDPGLQGKKDRLINGKAILYLDADEEFKAAKEARDVAREGLVSAIRKRGLTHYVDADVEVDLRERTGVKAKRRATEGEE